MAKQSRKDQIKGNIKGKGKKGQAPSLTAPLTTPEARHMAGAKARAEYQPTIGAIKGDIAGSKVRQKQEGEWFNTLGNQANESAAATDASYNQANAALVAHMNAAQAAAQGTMGQVAASDAHTSAVTGADPSLFAPTQAEGAAAANQRQITGAALAAPIAQAGASEAGYLRGVGLNARREGISQKQKEMSRRDKIKQDLTEARKGRAEKAQANFGDIRGEEFDRMIQNRAFPLEKQKLGLEQQEGTRKAQLEAEKNQREKEEQENENAETNRKGKNQGGLTPSEQHTRKAARESASAAAWRTIQANGIPKSAQEWAGMEAIVAKEEGVNAAQAREAVARIKARVKNHEAPWHPPMAP